MLAKLGKFSMYPCSSEYAGEIIESHVSAVNHVAPFLDSLTILTSLTLFTPASLCNHNNIKNKLISFDLLIYRQFTFCNSTFDKLQNFSESSRENRKRTGYF